MKHCLILLTLIFGLVAQVSAAEVKTLWNPPKLNREVKLSQEKFDAQTAEIKEIPYGNKAVAFRVRLPKTWQKLQSSSIPLHNGDFVGELARYLSPPQLDLRSSFQMRAYDLSFLITAKSWFINFLHTNNYTLQGMDEADDRRVQAHYVKVENGVQYVIRAVAQITGSKIILAEYSVPLEMWQAERDTAIRAMASFVLTSPDQSPIEDLTIYDLQNIAKFSFPKSWILIKPASLPDHVKAILINVKGGMPTKKIDPDDVYMDGRIDMTAVARKPGVTLASEATRLKTDLAGKGLILGTLVESIPDWPLDPKLKSSKIEVYQLNNLQNRLIAYEEWVVLLETPTQIYNISMLSIGRNEDFYNWVRNRETYRKVLTTLSPL